MNNNEAIIIEKNRTICEFMGWEFKEESLDWFMAYFEGRRMWADTKNGLNGVLLRGFIFHEDWNKLMEVVEKIEKIKGIHCVISELGCDIYSFGKHISNIGGRATKKNNVYEAVYQFIQWYNQQTKPEHNEQSKTSK